MARRAKSPKRFYRCASCRSFVPMGYKVCGTCGYNPDADPAEQLIRKALVMFPGSREIAKE